MLDFPLWDGCQLFLQVLSERTCSPVSLLPAPATQAPSPQAREATSFYQFGLVWEDVEGGRVKTCCQNAAVVELIPDTQRPQAPEKPLKKKMKKKIAFDPGDVVRRSTAAQLANPQLPSDEPTATQGRPGRTGDTEPGGLLTNISGENKLIKTPRHNCRGRRLEKPCVLLRMPPPISGALPARGSCHVPCRMAHRVSGLETAHRIIPRRS